MNLTEYRNSPSEQARIGDLNSLLPGQGRHALDVGARDGYISKILAEKFTQVTALDLEMPTIEHARVICVQGNITALPFSDGTFDLVFCAEVLEHIPSDLLTTACRELARVSGDRLLIGVPYRQDIRLGRTTCGNCGKINPPWGHVNTFDENRLTALFPGFKVERKTFVGKTNEHTNALSTFLMDFAGNPYGTYSQEEPCIHCGGSLIGPRERTFFQKVATKLAFLAVGAQRPFVKEHGNWIHLLFKRL